MPYERNGASSDGYFTKVPGYTHVSLALRPVNDPLQYIWIQGLTVATTGLPDDPYTQELLYGGMV